MVAFNKMCMEFGALLKLRTWKALKTVETVWTRTKYLLLERGSCSLSKKLQESCWLSSIYPKFKWILRAWTQRRSKTETSGHNSDSFDDSPKFFRKKWVWFPNSILQLDINQFKSACRRSQDRKLHLQTESRADSQIAETTVEQCEHDEVKPIKIFS